MQNNREPNPESRTTDDRDLLAHTTIQVASDLPKQSIAHLIAALQRVPGVLLADWVPASARAIVAHDAGVPVAALIAAAGGTGLHALVLGAPSSATAATAVADPASTLRLRRFFAAAAIIMFVAAIITTFDPRLASNHLMLPLVLSGLWAVIIAEAMFRRTR
jgi:hypothetical protein